MEMPVRTNHLLTFVNWDINVMVNMLFCWLTGGEISLADAIKSIFESLNTIWSFIYNDLVIVLIKQPPGAI